MALAWGEARYCTLAGRFLQKAAYSGLLVAVESLEAVKVLVLEADIRGRSGV